MSNLQLNGHTYIHICTFLSRLISYANIFLMAIWNGLINIIKELKQSIKTQNTIYLQVNYNRLRLIIAEDFYVFIIKQISSYH